MIKILFFSFSINQYFTRSRLFPLSSPKRLFSELGICGFVLETTTSQLWALFVRLLGSVPHLLCETVWGEISGSDCDCGRGGGVSLLYSPKKPESLPVFSANFLAFPEGKRAMKKIFRTNSAKFSSWNFNDGRRIRKQFARVTVPTENLPPGS